MKNRIPLSRANEVCSTLMYNNINYVPSSPPRYYPTPSARSRFNSKYHGARKRWGVREHPPTPQKKKSIVGIGQDGLHAIRLSRSVLQ